MLLLTVLMMITLAETGYAANIIAGKGCGTVTVIRTVEKPTETDACVIVLSDKEFNAYQKKRAEALQGSVPKYLPPEWSEWTACDIALSQGDQYPHPSEYFPVIGTVFFSGTFAMTMLEKIVQTSTGLTIGTWCSFSGDDDVFTKMTYCDGDGGRSAVVSVQCGINDELQFIDENPVNVYNFNFKTYGACWKLCGPGTKKTVSLSCSDPLPEDYVCSDTNITPKQEFCLYQTCSNGCIGSDLNCCSPSSQCKIDEGPCTTDSDCADILTCQPGSCSFDLEQACCQFPRCDENYPGDQDTCCQGYQVYGSECQHGEGVCTTDSDCAGLSECRSSSCTWDLGKSCCYDVCEDIQIIESCQYRGMRVTGTDIISPYQSQSLDDCYIDCVDNIACHAYSWRCSDSQCELKGSGSTYEEGIGYISGPKNCSCIEPNWDKAGSDIRHTGGIHTMGDCQAYCRDTPNCVIFQFSTDRPKTVSYSYCWAKGVGPYNEFENHAYITGPANCP